jgi:Domain of unknown function (DUF397)
MTDEFSDAWFRKADTSNNHGCVEVAFIPQMVGVRDSKAHGDGPVLSFTSHEWQCFIDGVKKGEFDLPT